MPKVQLFFDLRVPCPERALTSRNANVLMPKEDVSVNTEFYQRLEKFRAERAEKKKKGIINQRLFIPGKILHVVEVREGDDSSCIAYWASRSEFESIVLSSRMASDHSLKNLSDILINMHLGKTSGDQKASAASVDNLTLSLLGEREDEGPDETDVRLFMCCSNPYGRLPIVLALVVTASLIISTIVMDSCSIFSNRILLRFGDGVGVPFLRVSTGLFSYRLLTCEKTNNQCAFEDYVDSEFCVPYSSDDKDDNFMESAQGCAALGVLFGGLAAFLLWVSTCYRIRRWAWVLCTTLLLLASLCQGLVYLAKLSRDCNQSISSDESESDDTMIMFGFTLESECFLNTGSVYVIVACCLYFTAAVGSSCFAKMLSKKTNLSS